jgi:hypothetical protein
MPTRQHLIENECIAMGWSLERVALATEEKMIAALLEFKSKKDISSTSSLMMTKEKDVSLEECKIPFSLPLSPPPLPPPLPLSRPLLSTTTKKQDETNVDFHMLTIQNVRINQKLKWDYVSSTDAVPEDIKRFQDSIKKDQHRLEESMVVIFTSLELVRSTIEKKHGVYELLKEVMQTDSSNEDDVIHMKHVENQLISLKQQQTELEMILK